MTADRELGAFARVDNTDAVDFIDRLDRMHQFEGFRVYKQQSIAALRLKAGDRVADIGCGAGDDAARLAEIVGPGGAATGIDLSQAMVDAASQRFAATANLSFQCASADRLPFTSGALDAIRIDRVLIHVPDPAAAIAEMIRVLKPGGSIVVTEPDMIGFWVSSDDRETAGAVSRTIAGSCANPYLPRDLGNMMGASGLDGVEFSAVAMLCHDFTTVDRVVQFEVVARAMIQLGVAPADRVEAWLQDQRDRTAAGRFYACLNVMMAVAAKPLENAAP